MFTTVTVPTNFGHGSNRALRTAAVLARRAQAGLQLITVTEPGHGDDVSARLDELVAGLEDGTCSRVIESERKPADVLTEELRGARNELWCIGSHGRSGIGEVVLGSVSEALVRQSFAPVVLVGPHVRDAPVGDVLAVSLDGSAQSESVLKVVGSVAAGLEMSLLLLHVVAAPVAVGGPPDFQPGSYLQAVTSRYRPEVPMDVNVLHGSDVADALVEHAAHRPEVAMIAMTTRAMEGADRWRHASTTFEVAHRASVPVLAYHPW